MTDKLNKLKKTSFWIDYITIYISIITVSILVQIVILQLDLLLLFYCLAKSIFTTMPNVAIIMYGKSKKTINQNKFLEAILFIVSSLPYLELFLIFGYEQNWETSYKVLILYVLAYFLMGLFNRPYLRFIKKLVIFGLDPNRKIKKYKGKSQGVTSPALFF